jgi:hypothetical protein
MQRKPARDPLDRKRPDRGATDGDLRLEGPETGSALHAYGAAEKLASAAMHLVRLDENANETVPLSPGVTLVGQIGS